MQGERCCASMRWSFTEIISYDERLVFVIQLIFLCSGLAMADPVISLKALLHEMTDPPEVSLTNGEVSLLLVNLGLVNLRKGKNELQIESIALAPGHDTGFFGIDKLTLCK